MQVFGSACNKARYIIPEEGKEASFCRGPDVTRAKWTKGSVESEERDGESPDSICMIADSALLGKAPPRPCEHRLNVYDG